jgi:hypothetical protein
VVLIADQIEGRPAAPCGLGERASQGGAVDQPLRRIDQRLFGLVEIPREQRKDPFGRQRQEAFGIGADLGAERRGLKLGEQRSGDSPAGAERTFGWRNKSAKGHSRSSCACASANVGHEATASMKSVSFHELIVRSHSVTSNSRS